MVVAAIDPLKFKSTVDDIHSAVADAGKTVKDLNAAIATYKTFGDKANVSLDKVDKLIAAIDPEKVQGSVGDIHAAIADARDTIANFKLLSQNIDKRRADIDKTITNITQLTENLNKSSGKVDGVIDKASSLIAAVNPNEISAAVADARTAIGNFKGISQDIDKRRADIDSTISNISEMSAKLNKASTRVDGVLAKVDSFLGTGDSKSLFADARETLKSFKQVADTLNARIGPIADNLQRFSGSGLKNIDALVDDTRRTMSSLNQAITRFDSNPQRLLFGGEEVKQYDGRTRR
jgi:phospholipid/cholesterol/gamma-HCH transport system substrate-binding protein